MELRCMLLVIKSMRSMNTVYLLPLMYQQPVMFNVFQYQSQEQLPTGMAFNNDGTKMFVVGNTGYDVNEYTLSTAFDISTASYTQNFLQ